MKHFFSHILFAIAVVIVVDATNAQDNVSTDSILSLLRSQREGKGSQQYDKFHLPLKCGTPLLKSIRERWQALTVLQQEQFRLYTATKAFHKQRVIGNFHFYYDTTGTDAAAMLNSNNIPLEGTAEEYIDSLGVIFNYVKDIEINQLGYKSPNAFLFPMTVEVLNLTTIYGDANGFKIRLDNDFSDFPTVGLNAARVTAAHEFHHNIQNAYAADPDRFYMELTSVWMEEIVYNEVNDYYNYLRSYKGLLGNPSATFFSTDRTIEYSRGVWGKFLEEKFLHEYQTTDTGRAIMKRSWEYISRGNTAHISIDSALLPHGGFSIAFGEFTKWNLFIGRNADTVHYYSEGKNYYWLEPIGNGYGKRFDNPRFEDVHNVTGIRYTLVDSFIPNFAVRYLQTQINADTIFTMLSHHSMTVGGNVPFRYRIQQEEGDSSFHKLPNFLFTKLETRNGNLWTNANLNDWTTFELVTRATTEENLIIYPNPFVYDGSKNLKIQLPASAGDKVSLNIISVDLASVYSGTNLFAYEDFREQIGYRSRVVEWNGKTDENDVPSTGIYFVILSSGEKQWLGKFAFIRK